MAQKKLVIIDTFSLLHRAWHALPPTLTTSDGQVVNAVFGFTSILLKLIQDLKPDYMAAAFDLAEPTFRHEEYTEYKAQREQQPDELYEQVAIIEDLLDAFNIPRLSKKGFEADDIIGTIAKKINKEHKDIKVIIVTGDLDALQLVNRQTEVYTMKRGINDTIQYGVTTVRDRYQMEPQQLIDMKALKGDASDNIPGVRGIGEKGAIDLIKEFKSLDGIYKNIASPKIRERVRKLLTEQKREAYQSQHLVTIACDVKISFDLSEAELGDFDKNHVYDMFRKLEFHSLLNKIPTSRGDTKGSEGKTGIPTTKDTYTLIKGKVAMTDFALKLAQQKIFALDTESTGLDTQQAEILGASFSWEAEQGFFVSLRTDADRKLFVEIFASILEDPKIKKVGHNIKYDYQILKMAGIQLAGIAFDTMIAAYLVKPNRGLKLDDLAFGYFKRKMVALADINPSDEKVITMTDIAEEDLSWYAAEDADITWRLYQKLKDEIKKAEIQKLLDDIETPLIAILAEMELAGIKIDETFLKKMEKRFDENIAKLTQKIYTTAGAEFNIASPLQLKEILFEKLAIDTKGLKKTKTGISTAASELEKMRDRHPIIEMISEYRELTKLQSTYITALPKLISERDGRIHTSFNQTVAATGRLSSSDPNLQNIPIRTELGRHIRQAFVAEKGHVLISADYSQIELRLAAHISGDKNMVASFKKGEDIHRATAAAINNIPQDKVTYDERRKAKEVNFGVIYGLGSRGLAQRTGISVEEAKEFIAKYFDVYKGVKKYIDETKERVHQIGYVETMFGRRRALPEINSRMPQLVAQAERMAVNMPLQGSAADIMKLAMIKLAETLPRVSSDARLLLQVHDELVVEAPHDMVQEIAQAIKAAMENIVELKVPLTVDVKAGTNWAEMEEINL